MFFGEFRSKTLRLRTRSYYVKPVVNASFKVDKQGGHWIPWHANGGVLPASIKALQAAGWPTALIEELQAQAQQE